MHDLLNNSEVSMYICTICDHVLQQNCELKTKKNSWDLLTILQDLKSKKLSLNEAVDVAQNRPLWRLMSTFGSVHS